MNNLNISDDKLNALLNMAGKKLGQDPGALKSQIESGNLDSVLSKMDDKSKAQMNNMLQNPKALEDLMSNDKIKNLVNSFLGGQK